MKLLIVDDAPDMRLLLSRWADKKGYDYQVAEDGEQAWEMLMEEEFHIVISDWLMPKITGPELCGRIRSHSFNNYVYIILLTGMSDTKNMIAGLNSGADDYCNKPLNFEELEVRIGTAKRVVGLESKLEAKNSDLQKAYDALEHLHRSLGQDLEHASLLQRALLPEQDKASQLDYAWYFRPAIQVGGDALHTSFIREDLAVFYLVDVSGHGVSAAMMSISLHTLINSVEDELTNISAEEIPSLVVKTINQKITELELNHYCTMIYGAIDFKAKQIFYIQAGHPNPVLKKVSTDQAIELDGTGFPVGLIDNATFETHTIDYDEGDSLLIYSDGFSDLMTEEFPDKNLAQVCHPCFADSAQKAISEIESTLLVDGVIARQEDDISMMVLNL